MNREFVIQEVLEAVSSSQAASGRDIDELGPKTRPFRDIQGFDSMSGVEVTVSLSKSLDRELPDTVFIPDKGKRILSINEIADNICDFMNSGSYGE